MISNADENRASDRPPIEIFCSYASEPEDEALLQKLEQHLSPLQRLGRLILRHQGQIIAGKDHTAVINEWEACASVILLLISPPF